MKRHHRDTENTETTEKSFCVDLSQEGRLCALGVLCVSVVTLE